jgi:hypothetical protein
MKRVGSLSEEVSDIRCMKLFLDSPSAGILNELYILWKERRVFPKNAPRARHENGKQQIFFLASSMPSPQLSLDEIQGKIQSIAATLHISETEQHRLILNGWVAAVNKVLAEDPRAMMKYKSS